MCISDFFNWKRSVRGFGKRLKRKKTYTCILFIIVVIKNKAAKILHLQINEKERRKHRVLLVRNDWPMNKNGTK